jgi:hypothetical protein
MFNSLFVWNKNIKIVVILCGILYIFTSTWSPVIPIIIPDTSKEADVNPTSNEIKPDVFFTHVLNIWL